MNRSRLNGPLLSLCNSVTESNGIFKNTESRRALGHSSKHPGECAVGVKPFLLHILSFLQKGSMFLVGDEILYLFTQEHHSSLP